MEDKNYLNIELDIKTLTKQHLNALLAKRKDFVAILAKQIDEVLLEIEQINDELKLRGEKN